MLFNSADFIFFLPVVFVLFYLLPHKLRPVLLLLASYFFYATWNSAYLVLIIFSTALGFTTGLGLSKITRLLYRKLLLSFSIILNLGLLVYFKYAGFILENINAIGTSLSGSFSTIDFIDIILPVGISFYTFQILSYTIDVYHKKIQAEDNPFIFALYVSFFPQLVAGPIERYSKLAPQFKKPAFITIDNLSQGCRLILYGLFMKMVVADNLATIVDGTYSSIGDSSSLNLLIAAVFYSFQIYCDFHGYSTIAIGVAKLFNVELSQNFRMPYFSSSLTSFWRNWHITLTNFFRDYIYYPMGGNKESKLKWVVAVLIVFVVSGIWHGASWTFLIWGLLHGVLTLVEKALRFNNTTKALKPLKVLVTFMMVTLLWVFFRSPNLETANSFLLGIYNNWAISFQPVEIEPFILLAVFIGFELIARKSDFSTQLSKYILPVRWTIYFVLVFAILSRSGADTNPFIYFQF